MPSAAQDTRALLAKTLLALGSETKSAEQTADLAMQIWLGMAGALSPIVGQRGVAALYKRSLQLACGEFVWLVSVRDEVDHVPEFTGLRAALAQQTSPVAAEANLALLVTFHDLLTSLIGRSLTDRLLQSVWDQLSSGDAAQDTSP